MGGALEEVSVKRALTIALLATLLGILLFGLTDLFPPAEVRPWAEMARAYGAGNGVASIVLGSRLYDTLL